MTHSAIIRTRDDIERVLGFEGRRLKGYWSGEQPIEVTFKIAQDNYSLSQIKFAHSIFNDCARHFSHKVPVKPEDMKDILKMKFLGVEPERKIGDTVIPAKIVSLSSLKKGELTDFITQLMDWCFDHGVPIRNPRDGEYMELMRSQNS